MSQLPNGRIQHYDSSYNHRVDTRFGSPRAVCEDDRSLFGHPIKPPPGDDPPSYDAVVGGRTPPSDDKPGVPPDTAAGPSTHSEHRRGVFGRLKDKAIGTKEERREQRRFRAEQAAQADEQARQARSRQRQEREAYMWAHGGYAPYHPSGAMRTGPYDGLGPALGPGSDSTAALLLGALAGGLLLGDILSDGF